MVIELYDTIIDKGVCSRRRPDAVIDGTYRKIVVEVDERQHQHSGYAGDCEYRRMWEIAQALGMPTTFIRYNPDAYKTAGKRRDPPLAERIEVLLRWINTLRPRETLPGAFLTVLYLYYDDFDTSESVTESALADPIAALTKVRAAVTKITDDEFDQLFELL